MNDEKCNYLKWLNHMMSKDPGYISESSDKDGWHSYGNIRRYDNGDWYDIRNHGPFGKCLIENGIIIDFRLEGIV